MTAAIGPRIGLVTDSTAQLLDQEQAELAQVTGGLFCTVALSLELDGRSHHDGELTPRELCDAMAAGQMPTTSMPPAVDFAAAYAQLVAAGADEIVVLTMPAAISGTNGAARQAAAEADVPVQVIDTLTTSAGLAQALTVAGGQIGAGVDPQAVCAAVQTFCEQHTAVFFCPASLEYLRRGGRIGQAASLLGKALSIVPILTLKDGAVAPVARVRTWSKALARLASLVVDAATQMPAAAVVVDVQHASGEHGADSEKVAELITRAAAEAGVELRLRYRTLSTILTAHVGPGTIGVTVSCEAG